MHEQLGGVCSCELCQLVDLSTLQSQLSGSRSHYFLFIIKKAFSIAAFICSFSPTVNMLQVLEKCKGRRLQRYRLLTECKVPFCKTLNITTSPGDACNHIFKIASCEWWKEVSNKALTYHHRLISDHLGYIMSIYHFLSGLFLGLTISCGKYLLFICLMLH